MHTHTHTRAVAHAGTCTVHRRQGGTGTGYVAGRWGGRGSLTRDQLPLLCSRDRAKLYAAGEGTAPNPEFYFCTADNRSRAHSSHVPYVRVRFYVVVFHTRERSRTSVPSKPDWPRCSFSVFVSTSPPSGHGPRWSGVDRGGIRRISVS